MRFATLRQAQDKFFVLLLITSIVVGFLFFNREKKNVNPSLSVSFSPIPSVLPYQTLSHNSSTFAVYTEKIDPTKLILVPNFQAQLSSGEIMKNNQCKAGINGGFYTSEKKPLGLFFVNGAFINESVHTQSFLNGFLFGNNYGILDITKEVPHFRENSLDFIMQSGPLFTPETVLHIRDDEYTRRMLIGKTEQDEWYLIAITEEGNTNSGPLLGDLPEIIQKLNNSPLITYNLQLVLNLDGGSASAFYSSKGTTLSELTTIGSFLCVRAN